MLWGTFLSSSRDRRFLERAGLMRGIVYSFYQFCSLVISNVVMEASYVLAHVYQPIGSRCRRVLGEVGIGGVGMCGKFSSSSLPLAKRAESVDVKWTRAIDWITATAIRSVCC